MKKGKRVWTCAVLLSAAFLSLTGNGVSGLIPVQSVSAAAAVYSGTCGDVGWSFDRGSGTLTLKALKDGQQCSTNLSVWNGKAYLYHQMEGSYIPAEQYYTPQWLVPWEAYRDEIKTMILPENVSLHAYGSDGNTYFQFLAGKIICQKADGYAWEYDRGTDTLTYSGKGPLSYNHMEQQEDALVSVGYFQAFVNDSFLTPGTIILSDGLTEVDFLPVCDRLVIGKDAEIGLLQVRKEYAVDAANPYYAVYNGALYTKDYRKLVDLSADETDPVYHPALEVLGTECLNTSLKSPVVIPWGVKQLEKSAFSDLHWSVDIVLPDTLTTLEEGSLSVPRGSSGKFYFTKKNAALMGLTANYHGDSPLVDYAEYFSRELGQECILLDSLDKYYPDTAASGFVTDGDKTWYYKDGQYIIGYQVINGKRYVFDDNGVMQHSKWVQIYNVWHYLNDNGAAVVNCWRLKDGKYVYLGEYGGMKTGCWIKDYGYWYYVKADGSRYESSWAKINGVWYWFGGSGKMAQSQWLKLGGKWYYFTGSGAMAANKWVKSGAYWYYLGSDGAMLTNTVTPDGYRVDAQGRWI